MPSPSVSAVGAIPPVGNRPCGAGSCARPSSGRPVVARARGTTAAPVAGAAAAGAAEPPPPPTALRSTVPSELEVRCGGAAAGGGGGRRFDVGGRRVAESDQLVVTAAREGRPVVEADERRDRGSGEQHDADQTEREGGGLTQVAARLLEPGVQPSPTGPAVV